MRKLQIWFVSVSIIIGIVIVWAGIVLSGIRTMISGFNEGFYFGVVAQGILLVLITLYCIFDLVIHIIKETRSIK